MFMLGGAPRREGAGMLLPQSLTLLPGTPLRDLERHE
jgi:hypothetical protein